MHALIHTYTRIKMHARTFMRTTNAFTHSRTNTCTHSCVCLCIYAFVVCVCVCVHVCVCGRDGHSDLGSQSRDDLEI